MSTATVSTLFDLAQVCWSLPSVEWSRRYAGPRPAAAAARAKGLENPGRSIEARARLQRSIRWVDALVPGGRDCYRRALLEMTLDAGAAREPLMLGLRADGRPRSGHAWLASAPDGARGDYDCVLSV